MQTNFIKNIKKTNPRMPKDYLLSLLACIAIIAPQVYTRISTTSQMIDLELDSEPEIYFFTHRFISDIFSYFVVGISPLTRFFQLRKCYKDSGAKGVSFTSTALDTLNYIINFGYCYHHGYPIAAYAEFIMLISMSILLLVQIYYYEGSHRPHSKNPEALTFINLIGTLAALLGSLAGYFMNLYPEPLYKLMISTTGFFLFSSKAAQIALI